MILSARFCSTTVALTEAPSSNGAPVATSAPSPIISTSASSTVAPGSAASFSTEMTSSLATLYCLPPVLITANMTPADMVCRASDATAKGTHRYHARGHPVRERRTIGAPGGLSTASLVRAIERISIGEDEMTLIERIEREGQKKLLAIDGGGIHGVLALEVLHRIEDLLKAKSGRGDFRLADYFDYIAGTSTGGIIAAGLSMGMSVGEILTFYQDAGAQMFVKANLLRRLRYKFEDEPLAKKLKEVFKVSTMFGSDRLRTLLLLVMRNASTDTPWPISNNTYAKYNDGAREDCNLNFPFWQLVRASTAAPTFFPPDVIVLPNADPTREEGVRFRRWRRHDVQQPRLPDVSDGDTRSVLARKTRSALAIGHRSHVNRLGRYGHESCCAAGSRARRDEPPVQRDDNSVCLDVRRPERAGSVVLGVRRLPRGRRDRPRSGRPRRQRWAITARPEALRLPALQRRADPRRPRRARLSRHRA